MARIVGVRFKKVGKIYHFSPGDLDINVGDRVIVETARGLEYGTVAVGIREDARTKGSQPLKEVIRIATEEDAELDRTNKEKEIEALGICIDLVKKHELGMKLIDCEITFDRSKILFYFTADGRVDFRELVKELASVFHTRIELRQEGVRDEAKKLGGLGCCGREFCCKTYLTDFIPVSIKMAKTQKLSLNAGKISGVCGRFMCCLKYEEEVYEELSKELPAQGDRVLTPDGLRGVVTSIELIKQKAKVLTELSEDDKELRDYDARELRITHRKKGGKVHEQEEDFAPLDLKKPEEKTDPEDAETPAAHPARKASGSRDRKKRRERAPKQQREAVDEEKGASRM